MKKPTETLSSHWISAFAKTSINTQKYPSKNTPNKNTLNPDLFLYIRDFSIVTFSTKPIESRKLNGSGCLGEKG